MLSASIHEAFEASLRAVLRLHSTKARPGVSRVRSCTMLLACTMVGSYQIGTPGDSRIPQWSHAAAVESSAQMLPITSVSERLLRPRWVEQMLPSFEDSCIYDINPSMPCVAEGWSMLVHAAQAITGR